MIAYSTIENEYEDIEDVNFNTAILFKNSDDCLNFFSKKENVMTLLGLKSKDEVYYMVFNNNKEILPIQVVLESESIGKILIKRMLKGYVFRG